MGDFDRVLLPDRPCRDPDGHLPDDDGGWCVRCGLLFRVASDAPIPRPQPRRSKTDKRRAAQAVAWALVDGIATVDGVMFATGLDRSHVHSALDRLMSVRLAYRDGDRWSTLHGVRNEMSRNESARRVEAVFGPRHAPLPISEPHQVRKLHPKVERTEDALERVGLLEAEWVGHTGYIASKRARALARRDGDVCWWCGREFAPPQFARTVDHVMPRSLGGSDRMPNLVLACRSCNQRKGNRHPLVWIASLFTR